jgi:two-component system, OmpR family, response regulator VicR
MMRVLIVDDELEVAKSLKRLLRRQGYLVELAGSGEEGLERLGSFTPEVILSDFRMGGMDGVAFLTEAARRAPAAVRILISGDAGTESGSELATHTALHRFVKKPWDDDELVALIRGLLEGRASARGLTVIPGGLGADERA